VVTSLVFQPLFLMDRKRCCGWAMLVLVSRIFSLIIVPVVTEIIVLIII